MEKKILLSFVIPCYRSQNTILKVVDEIERTVKTRDGYDYEIILVNDGSPDNVWSVISELADENSHVTAINLAKNFGQHSALLAGYNHCSGDYVISLDDDGQTPADELYKLVDKLEEGYDVVYASYGEVRQNIIRRLGSRFAKKMAEYMLDVPKNNNNNASSYYIARKFIIDEMTRYKNPYPYMVGLVLGTTRNFGFVFVTHRNRMEGKSGYSLKSLISLWMNGFTAFSVKPLRIGSYIGFFTAAAGFLYALYVIIKKIFFVPEMEAGWSSTISILMIIGGVIMIMLGLIGEYIGRIYICINNSPQYVIKEIKSQKDRPKQEKNN